MGVVTLSDDKIIKQRYTVDFKKLAQLMYSDLEAKDTTNVLFSAFSKKQVADALQNPQKNEKFLRDLSKFLYVLSPHYKRLCDYYGDMPKFHWYISPLSLQIDKSKINKNMMSLSYSKHLSYYNNMSIPHECGKINSIIFREGIYYGYKYESDDSFFFQKLDPDYCKITGVADGCYTFAFDFTYFNNANTNVKNYAPEFQKKYQEYLDAKADKTIKRTELSNYQWRNLDVENTICIKADETIQYPFPPFVGVVPDLYDIQEYKNLKKSSEKLKNTAIVVGSIPINNKSEIANDFLVDLDTAIEFGNKIAGQLPDQMAFLLSVYDKMEMLKFDKDLGNIDRVEEAVKNFWNASGTQEGLFTGSGSTDASMDRAIATDEQSIFRVMRQIERWMNRNMKLLNYFGSTYKFTFQFLDITNLNWKKAVEQEFKIAQFGIPNKIRLCTSIGMNQSEVNDMAYLENELLGLVEMFEPLVSSNTMSATQDTGRPNANEDGSVGE